MKTDAKAVRTTIIFGILAGVFSPAAQIILLPFFGYKSLPLVLWLILAVYSVMLVRWSGRSLLTIFFPLLLNLAVSFWLDPRFVGVAVGLMTLSWIRSGICFAEQPVRKVVLEVLLCGGGAFLVASFSPQAPLATGLGIWLFMVIQAGYFILTGLDRDEAPAKSADRYEQARRQAEAIVGG